MDLVLLFPLSVGTIQAKGLEKEGFGLVIG